MNLKVRRLFVNGSWVFFIARLVFGFDSNLLRIVENFCVNVYLYFFDYKISYLFYVIIFRIVSCEFYFIGFFKKRSF